MKINNLIKPQENRILTVDDFVQGDIIYFPGRDPEADYPYLISDSDVWLVGIGEHNLGQIISLEDEDYEHLNYIRAIKVNAEITLKNLKRGWQAQPYMV